VSVLRCVRGLDGRNEAIAFRPVYLGLTSDPPSPTIAITVADGPWSGDGENALADGVSILPKTIGSYSVRMPVVGNARPSS
jgi:hypothetical protein